MGESGKAGSRLAVSGGAERRRRTTRRCIKKVLQDVVVRRIAANVRCIFIEIFVNVLLMKNIPQG